MVLWSTGFIAAKLALPDADPMRFLAWRYALVVAILAPAAVIAGRRWPGRLVDYRDAAITGVSLHCLGLGGVFLAIDRGVEAGVSALIMALQPVLAALVAVPLLGERIGPGRMVGLALGLAGVALVVVDRLEGGIGTLSGVAWNALGVLAVTTGTLFQKARSQRLDPWTGMAVQFAAAALACMALGAAFGESAMRWTPAVLGALAWSVLVLSVVATSLLYWLIRRGAVAAVSSLFYLVPPSAAVLAWALLGERLSPLAIAGMAVTVIGVGLVTRGSPGRSGAG